MKPREEISKIRLVRMVGSLKVRSKGAGSPAANDWQIPRFLHFNPVHQLTEISGVDAQVIRQVFVRNPLQHMRTSLQELPESFFRSVALQFNQPFQHPGQRKSNALPHHPFNGGFGLHQFLELAEWGT
jgi:hypothetical protein